MKAISKNVRLILTALIFGAALMSGLESKAMDSKNNSNDLNHKRMAGIKNICQRVKNTPNLPEPFTDRAQGYLTECDLVAVMMQHSNLFSPDDKRSADNMAFWSRILHNEIRKRQMSQLTENNK